MSTTAAQTSERRVTSPTQSSTSSHRDSLSVPQSPLGGRAPPSSTTRDTTDRTNGFHQPPPSDLTDDHTPKARSSIDEAKRASGPAPRISASINAAGDFANHNHYYANSTDSNSNITSSSRPTSEASVPGIKPPTSKYRITNQDEVDSSSEATPTDSTPTKTDSFTRRTAYGRRGTGGLQRQSLVNKHDSAEPEQEQSKGVQLEDKPMDFD